MAMHRLPDQKYSEAEYLFQTIEMAKSDEEYDVELTSTPPQATEIVDLELVQEPKIFSYAIVTRRQRPLRRYTVSHGGSPPAPPSTPTSLTASSTPTPSPTATTTVHADDESLNNLFYIFDYLPKYNMKLKEQQRTDDELSELFNVVAITSSGTGGTSSYSKSRKLPPERGVSTISRVIRKQDSSTKIFKIHRNPNEFFREPDEEDSISAPEYDTEEDDTRYRRLARHKPSRRFLQTKRQRRFARFEHQERMEVMVDNFGAAMTFTDAQ